MYHHAKTRRRVDRGGAGPDRDPDGEAPAQGAEGAGGVPGPDAGGPPGGRGAPRLRGQGALLQGDAGQDRGAQERLRAGAGRLRQPPDEGAVMRPWLRAAAGVFLVQASVRALLGADPHVSILAGAEIAFAVLYAWPRAPRWADAGLLAVMAVALAAHAVRGELAYVPAAAAIAIVALWPPRAVRPEDPEDAKALRVFGLRGAGE